MEDKKNAMMPIVLGVITLLVLVIGATYAYFAVGLSNNFGTTTINATTENVGTVTLSNINSTLSMNLTAADMMRQGGKSCEICIPGKIGCAFTGQSCVEGEENCLCTTNYNSLSYYATPTGKSTTENMAWEIGRATVSPNTDTNYYSCDYTLSVSNSGTNNMYTAFNNMPTEANATQARPNAYKSRGQVIFQINDTEYDWFTDDMPSTYSGNMIVSVDNPGHITAGLLLNNDSDIDQTDLAGTDVSISIQATAFSCSAVPVTYGYYNTNAGASNPDSTPGNKLYYIKQTIVNNTVIDSVVCGSFNGTEVCVKNNDWANHATYYTTFTNAGATCTYFDTNSDNENDMLSCSIDDDTPWCRIVQNGNASCNVKKNGSCIINSLGETNCL